MSTPCITLSFDFEIGWGDVTNGVWKKREAAGTYIKLRKVLPELLSEMKALQIPATWATVGAMIDAPLGSNFDYLPEGARRTVCDVLDTADPGSFDGRDLFEMLCSHTETGHNVASHSYAHVPFDFKDMSEQIVLYDLKRSLNALKKFGFESDRLVFPENTDRYYNAVLESGIRKVRSAPNICMSNRVRYLASTLYKAPPFSGTSVLPGGLVQESGSMLFSMGNHQPYRIPFVYNRGINGLKSLVNSEGKSVHIWAHPFNFAESNFLLKMFKKLLRKIAEFRDAGKLKIVLM